MAPSERDDVNVASIIRLAPAKALGAALIAASLLFGGPGMRSALADEAADFLAGRTRSCVDCALMNAPLKRKVLSGGDLSGANLADAVL
jgi:hypothetical protein